MLDLNKKLEQAIDENGIKVNVGFDNNDLILLGVIILGSVVLGGVLVAFLTRNFRSK